MTEMNQRRTLIPVAEVTKEKVGSEVGRLGLFVVTPLQGVGGMGSVSPCSPTLESFTSTVNFRIPGTVLLSLLRSDGFTSTL